MSIPIGWQLVPIEPTPEMLAHMRSVEPNPISSADLADKYTSYRRMLDAAPEYVASTEKPETLNWPTIKPDLIKHT